MAGGAAFLPFLLRALPSLMTILTANYMHYKTLHSATRAAQRAPGSGGKGEPERRRPVPSFELMRSPPMRRVRYWIRILRYTSTLLYILAVHPFLPELSDLGQAAGGGGGGGGGGGAVGAGQLYVSVGALYTALAGLAVGAATVALNENPGELMRTLWQPGADFGDRAVGTLFDVLNFAGASVSDPLEEELLFRSWLYRFLIYLRTNKFASFTDVPFGYWSWEAALASSFLCGWLNGSEWKSTSAAGLVYAALASRFGFVSAVVAHGFANLLIGAWVIVSGQRQFW